MWENGEIGQQRFKSILCIEEIIAVERWVAQLDDHNIVGALSNKEVTGEAEMSYRHPLATSIVETYLWRHDRTALVRMRVEG